MPAAPTTRSIKLEAMTPSGKASATEKNGVVTIKGNDAVAALQLLAKEGKVAIQLTSEEVERLTAAARIKVSASFTRGDGKSAIKAAQAISEQVAEAFLKGGQTGGGGIARRLALALLFIAVAAGAFLLAVVVLDALYGTSHLGRLLAG